MECTGTDIASERIVQETDKQTLRRRNVQGQTLQVRGKYSGEWTDITCERNVQKVDVSSLRKLRGTDARWRSH